MNEDTHIRLIHSDDMHELFALIIKNKKYLSRWLPWPNQTKSLEDTANFIKIATQMKNEKKAVFYSIVNSERLIGVVGANFTVNAPRKARLNYWVDEECTGKNIATFSTSQLINSLKNEFDIHNLEIHICTENIASINVAMKIGFTIVGTIENAERLNGKWVNNHVFINRVHTS